MLKTRHRESLMFNACLVAKQPVVVDNTNPTKLEREKYIAGFKKHHFEVIGYYFSSSLEDCLNRNALRIDKEKFPISALKAPTTNLKSPIMKKDLNVCFMSLSTITVLKSQTGTMNFNDLDQKMRVYETAHDHTAYYRESILWHELMGDASLP